MSTKLKSFMETPTSSLSIAADGTYDVTEYASASVEVIQVVSAVPATKTTDLIYNTTNSGFYVWEYPITTTLQNCTGSSSNPTIMMQGQTATLTFSAESSYALPSTVTVTGAEYTWTQSTGTLTLSNPSGDIGVSIDAELDYLCLTANTDGSTVTLNYNSSGSWSGQYSTDKSNWITYVPGTTGAITLANAGSHVYFKGAYTEYPWSSFDGLQFAMTGSISASGSVMSMCSGDDYINAKTIPGPYCFSKLFTDCTSLTTAPKLPATTLTDSCYGEMGTPGYGMFSGCTSLTTAPELPATTLAENCYATMFRGCTSLTTAPALPATTLAYACYYHMFYNCTSLTTVPELPATALANICYNGMFASCTSLYVSDSSISGTVEQVWAIPTSGTFTNTTTYTQSSIFYACLGTRASNDMSGAQGESHTYYTQNEPV